MHEPLYYVAHPVAADTEYTYEENLEHALWCYRQVLNAGYAAFMPWHTMLLVAPDGDVHWRARGIKLDCLTVARFDGIILTGHKLSGGMQRELLTFAMCGNTDLPDGQAIIDVTGVPDSRLLIELKKKRHGWNV